MAYTMLTTLISFIGPRPEDRESYKFMFVRPYVR